MRVESRHTCPTCTMVTKNRTPRAAPGDATWDIEMRDAEIGHGSWDNGDVDGAGQPDATRNAP